MGKEIEQKVAEAILQREKEVSIGGEIYKVPRPTTATLIVVSELVSTLPMVEMATEDILSEVLCVAKDCRVIGDIMAVLLLGEKNMKSTKKIVKKSFFGFKKEERTVEVDNVSELSNKLISELTPHDMRSLFTELLGTMQVADFFTLTAFLLGINLLRKTREADKKATVSGQ